MKKSTLRILFIAGVLVSSVAFIALTINTLAQMPVRTREQNLTTFVVAGKIAWQQHDCIDCHTILGNGAYYAPDLTKVAQTRGADFLASWLPAPMGQMPNQRLTADEVTGLVAFLTWVSNIDTNGWPPKPIVAISPPAPGAAEDPAAHGASLFENRGCAACHGAGGQGTPTAPGLIGVGTRLDGAYLARWLKDPAVVKPGTRMPNLRLDDADIAALVAYLATLK